MKKALIIGQFGLGDTISNTLPLVQVLKNHGYLVHGLFHNINSYHLMRETPYFDACILLASFYSATSYNMVGFKEMFKDVANIFSEYNKIYIQGGDIHEFMQKNIDDKLKENIVFHLKTAFNYRPIEQLEKYGFIFKDSYLFLDAGWYNKHWRDFNCQQNTVLFNTQSSQHVRNYPKRKEVINLLTQKGFDVRQFDYKEDIRVNLHLLNQANYVLTTDTSSYWIAKALKKEPHVFMSRGRDLIYSPEIQELKLQTRNILKEWKFEMSDIAPEEIVEEFIQSIKKDLCL